MNLILHNNKTGNELWSIKYPSIEEFVQATRFVTLYVPTQEVADFIDGHALIMGYTLKVTVHEEGMPTDIPHWFVRIEEWMS